jgi:hypothetical protein
MREQGTRGLRDQGTNGRRKGNRRSFDSAARRPSLRMTTKLSAPNVWAES